MDLGLLGMEAASLYILETTLKGVVYSIKLKLELAVLGKLVLLVGGARHNSEGSYYLSNCKRSIGLNNTVSSTSPQASRGRKMRRDKEQHNDLGCCDLRNSMDVSEFVDLRRLDATSGNESAGPHGDPMGRRETAEDLEEYAFARFEHVDDVRTLREC